MENKNYKDPEELKGVFWKICTENSSSRRITGDKEEYDFGNEGMCKR